MFMRSRIMQRAGGLAVIVGLLATGAWTAGGPGYRGPFGVGSVPSEAEIKARDIAAGPDGAGLPRPRHSWRQASKCISRVLRHNGQRARRPQDKLLARTPVNNWQLAVCHHGSIISAAPSPSISRDR
jgi:hypothetical protein